MEGVGSRLGRASSRYGAATTVFSGPVRKWKKRWVQVPSSSSTISYQNSHSHSNAQNNGGSRLLLCRWTPISPSTAAGDGEGGGEKSSGSAEEPPRRKFRYTPIAVLEEKNAAVAKKVEDAAQISEANLNSGRPTSSSDWLTTDKVLKEETEGSNENPLDLPGSQTSHLDLGLGLKGNNSNSDSDGRDKEDQLKRVNSGGFWSME